MIETKGTPVKIWRRRLFGDEYGLCLFLAAALFLGLCWRFGFFITDSRTIANLLANVADGRLSVTETPYSLVSTNQPGLVEAGGQFYGRNYGQVYLAVPVVWLVQAVDDLLALPVVLSGLWAAGLVVLGILAATVFDRPKLQPVLAIGGLVAAVVGTTNGLPLDRFQLPSVLVALQLVTILTAAASATLLYRLLRRVDGQRVGLAGGLALIVATPVGFWGTIPKRHVYTAGLLLLACLCFVWSRETTGRRVALARGGAYASIGYLASIHAFEAAFMFAVLVPFDLAVHHDAELCEHAIVAALFVIGLTPMLATNIAIAGDPIGTPRTLAAAGPGDGGITSEVLGSQPPADGGGGGGATGPTTTGGSSIIAVGFTAISNLLAGVGWILEYMVQTLFEGADRLDQPAVLLHTFVRSGWIPGVNYAVNGWEAVELALLETFPLAGALIAGPFIGLGSRGRLVDHDHWRPIDGLALAMATTFILVYLPRLPLHSMITLRYLVPALALLTFLCCRLPPVSNAISDAWTTLTLSYTSTVVLGGASLVLAISFVDPAVGEAFQLHGLVGLAAAATTIAVVATWTRHQHRHLVAATVAIAAGVTTLFLLSAALWHLRYGPAVIDLARLVSELLPAVG